MTLSQRDRLSIMEVKAFLDEHYPKEITIRSLSQRVGFNPLKLQMGFRKMYDRPIYTYLTHLRMKTATELLTGSELSIKEIAAACGYNSSSDFTKLFKKYHTQSPKNYRSTHLTEDVYTISQLKYTNTQI